MALPTWDPVGRLAGRLTELRHAGLATLADEIAAGWPLVHAAYQQPRHLGEVVVHGDAHPGNLVGPPHQPKLIDMDRVAYAPAVSDLLRLAGWTAALGRPESWWRTAVASWADGVGAHPADVDEDICTLLPALVATTTCSAALTAQHETGTEDHTQSWLAAWRAIRDASTLLRPFEVAQHAADPT